jgi:hypothetical protein
MEVFELLITLFLCYNGSSFVLKMCNLKYSKFHVTAGQFCSIAFIFDSLL